MTTKFRIPMFALVAVTFVLLRMTVCDADPADAQSSAAPVVCRDIDTPVALTPGQPKTEHIYGQLCAPEGASSSAIQVLVPGITYTHDYWNFPDPTNLTDRYSYVNAANTAGFATLAIDRIGSGRSSKPLSEQINIYSNAHTVHQVIQSIRNGNISNPDHTKFQKVAYVGHSYGTWTGWYESSTYHDVDAVVFTGGTRKLIPVFAPKAVLANLQPVNVDGQFRTLQHDPGYMTTQPGKRYEMFYGPAKVDPAVLAYDEAHKGVTTAATELGTYPAILAHQLDVTAPSLLVDGSVDSLFCRPEVGGADCSNPQSLLRDEAGHLGPRVPSVDAFTLPGAGHDLNTALNAPKYFEFVQEWIGNKLGKQAVAGAPTPPTPEPAQTAPNPLSPGGDLLSETTKPVSPIGDAAAPLGSTPPINDIGKHLNPITGGVAQLDL